MEQRDVEFLRARIAREQEMARTASCESTAAIHTRLARLYEAQLEEEARRIVDRSHPPDAGIDEAIRRIT